MSLFVTALTLTLTPTELDLLQRSIIGDGGHQRLLLRVLESRDGITLRLDDDEIQKCYAYAYSYGGGGYQDRFRVIIAAAKRAGWMAP